MANYSLTFCSYSQRNCALHGILQHACSHILCWGDLFDDCEVRVIDNHKLCLQFLQWRNEREGEDHDELDRNERNLGMVVDAIPRWFEDDRKRLTNI